VDLREFWAFVNREKTATQLLVAAFLLLSVYMVGLPHDLEIKGHLKDEEGYYPWAELYLEGHYSLPLELVTGHYESVERFTVDTGASMLEVTAEMVALDPDGKVDDLRVSVAHTNGTPVNKALVRIPLPDHEFLQVNTTGNGQALLYDIPLGKPTVEVILERVGEPPLIVRVQMDAGTSGGPTRYTINSITTLEYLSDRALGGLLIARHPNGTPARNHTVSFNDRHLGRTGDDGRLELGDLAAKQGFLRLRDPDGDPPGPLDLTLAGDELPGLNNDGRVKLSVVERIKLVVTVQDLFGSPVKGARASLTQVPEGLPEELGQSAANGTLTAIRELGMSEYQLLVRLEVDGYKPPLASGIAEVDDEYRYVNHWPPGPSVALLPLMAVGVEDLFGSLMVGLTCLGTYGLGRRLWGWRVAWLGTAFTMGNGVVLILHFGQWMGDLAAVAFAFPGLWLAVEGAHNKNPYRGAGLALAGGVMMGVGVTMRYTTVLLCGAPYLYLAYLNIPDGKLRELPRRLRAALAWSNLRQPLTRVGALTLGLLLIGIPLAAYNSHYFGTAFNSGYQSKNTLELSGSGDNQTITTHEPSASMWDGYVNVGADERENVGQVAKFVVAFFPALLLIAPGLWAARHTRRGRGGALALIYWMVMLAAVYLTQSWVLNRVFTDIRYYLPLAPPAGLLAALGLQKIARALPGALRLPQGLKLPSKLLFVGLVSALVMASGWVAFDDAEHFLQIRYTHEPGSGPGGSGQAVQAPVFELVNQPDGYVGKMVKVGRAEVAERPGSAFMVLADDKHPEARLRLVVKNLPVEAGPGDIVKVTARFDPDDRNPEGYSLFLNRVEDLEVVEPAGDSGRGGNASDSRGDSTTIIAAQAQQQSPPPQGGQPPPPPPPGTKGKIDLTPGQRVARNLGLAAAALFYGAAMVVFIAGRRSGSDPGPVSVPALPLAGGLSSAK